MIDTHAHLNIEDFDQDINEVIERAKQAKLSKIIVIGMDEASNKKAIELAETYDLIYATVGIHPGYLLNSNVSSIEKFLSHPKVVAIGECGIDLYWDTSNLLNQKAIFKQQIELSEKYQLPLVIHTRNSFTEAYDLIKPFKGKVTGVFHCFSSNLEDAKKAIDLGFYIGIDGPITFKKNDILKEIIEAIDLKHILIETDSPYMTPTPYRGKRNEPSYLPFIAEKIAEIKHISVDEVIHITKMNSYKLFKKLEG